MGGARRGVGGAGGCVRWRRGRRRVAVRRSGWSGFGGSGGLRVVVVVVVVVLAVAVFAGVERDRLRYGTGFVRLSFLFGRLGRG